VLTLTDATWKQMLAMLATSPDGVERVAYLDGIRTGDGTSLGMGIVTTVTVPHAVQSAGHFTVSAQEMSRAGALHRSTRTPGTTPATAPSTTRAPTAARPVPSRSSCPGTPPATRPPPTAPSTSTTATAGAS
jgi:hypothetical protein